jgi:hypothetical protein
MQTNSHIFKRREWSLFQGRPYLHQNTVFIKMSEVGRTKGTSTNVRVMHTSRIGVAQWLWRLGTSWSENSLDKELALKSLLQEHNICFPVMTVTTEPLQLKILHLVHRNVISRLLCPKCCMLRTTHAVMANRTSEISILTSTAVELCTCRIICS